MNECFVYVIVGDVPPCKIGISNKPDLRRATLQAQELRPLQIAATWKMANREAAFLVEQLAHRSLSRFRERGEWFTVTPQKAIDAVHEALDAIRSLGDIPKAAWPFNVPEEDWDHVEEPPVIDVPDANFRVGLVCHTRAVSFVNQANWLMACGVDSRDIFIEEAGDARSKRWALIRDGQERDAVFVWSPEALGGDIPARRFCSMIRRQGGRVFFTSGAEDFPDEDAIYSDARNYYAQP